MSAVDEVAPPAGEGDGELPIDGYGDLTVAKVLPKLTGLSRAQLWRVHEFERSHANRVAILQAIEQALG